MTRPIRVFALAEFDPAGVVIGHRDALREVGADVSLVVALGTSYADAHRAADFVGSISRFVGPRIVRGQVPGAESDEATRAAVLAAFEAADVIQIHPGIGQPWGDGAGLAPRWRRNADDAPGCWFGLDWEGLLARAGKPIVAYFHGSTHTRAHVAAYAADCRERGYHLATSTIDYAIDLPAVYLPPTLPAVAARAPQRGDHDPLIVAHTPTNPEIAGTGDFFAIARALGLPTPYVFRRPHAEALRAKAESHATFDHLRGCFSVNALEAARVGSIPVFHLHDGAADELIARGFDAPPGMFVRERSREALMHALRALRDSPALTRDLQALSGLWWHRNYSRVPTSHAVRALVDFYRGLITC